jgi:UDP-glucose 4-epimerase
MVVDDLRTGWLSNLRVSPRVPVVNATLGSVVANGMIQNFRPTIVHHLSAQLEISKGLEDPAAEAREDILTTIGLLELCKSLPSVQHFVFSSSACVYDPDGHRKLEPAWTYGAAKLAAEAYTTLYGQYFATTSLRYGIVFGPREWYGRVLTNFARRAVAGQDLVLFGDSGEVTRDFTYVGDVADIHRRVTDEVRTGIYDVGSGGKTSLQTVAELIAEKTGVAVVTEDVEPGGDSTLMPGRLRLPNEMRHMTLCPERGMQTQSIVHANILDEYLDYARSQPEQWQSEHYRI